MNIYLIAGHCNADIGAPGISKIDGGDGINENEHVRNLRDAVAENLVDKNKRGLIPMPVCKPTEGLFEVIIDDDKMTLQQTIDWLRTQPPGLVVDFHMNSATPAATGSEAFYGVGSDVNSTVFDTPKIAKELSVVVSGILGIANRGAKPETNSQHPRLGMLHISKDHPGVLLETCFISSTLDMHKYISSFDKLTFGIAHCIHNLLITTYSKQNNV